jgi:hypothetical protein
MSDAIVTPPAETPVITRFLQLWHDPGDEPYGLVFAVTETFPEPLVAELKAMIPQLPAAARARLAGADSEAQDVVRVLVGLLGCIRGGVCDLACDALAAIGRDALPFLDATRTFGYEVDMKDGRNTLVLFGERALWEKMVRKAAMAIDPKRGNVVQRIVAKLFT